MQFLTFVACRADTGGALPFAHITVRTAGSAALASVFDAGGAEIQQPLVADANGIVGFAAANGRADILVSSADGSYSGPLLTNVQFADLDDAAADSAQARDQAESASRTATDAANKALVSANADLTTLFTVVGYINASSGDGRVDTNGNWFCTPFLPVALIGTPAFNLYGDPGAFSIAFFGQDRKLISGVAAPAAGAFVAAYPAVPANAVYVRFTANGDNLAQQSFAFSLQLGAVAPASTAPLLTLFTVTGYVNATTGQIGTNGNWLSTPMLPVGLVGTPQLNLYGDPGAASVSFFDARLGYLGGAVAAATGAFVDTYPAVPANAAYVRFTAASDHLADQSFSFTVQADAVRLASRDYAGATNVAGFIDPTGAVSTAAPAGWLHSDYIRIDKGWFACFDVPADSGMNVLSFYDATMTYVSGVSGARIGSGANRQCGAGLAPVDGFVRISFANISSYPSYVGEVSRPSVIIAPNVSAATARQPVVMPNDRIMLYGDSRSGPDYPWYRAEMARLTGATVKQGGIDGWTVAWLARNAEMATIFAYDPRWVIYLPGGNDNGAPGTVGTFSAASINGQAGEAVVTETDLTQDYGANGNGSTFVQAVSHMIRKFQANYYDIRARAGIVTGDTNDQINAKIRAVSKPILVLCTDLPQQRNSPTDPYSQPANWERKRQAIIECAGKYRVKLVDTMVECGFTMAGEPYQTGPIDLTTNNGVYFLDGLHSNEFGAQIIARLVVQDALS